MNRIGNTHACGPPYMSVFCILWSIWRLPLLQIESDLVVHASE